VENITFGQLAGLAALVLVLVAAYNTIMTAVKNYREEKSRKDKPVNTLENKVNDHEERLDRDHKRLNDLEESNRIIMRALMAMLSHEINGNSDERLRASYDEIQQFLIDR
jgi:cell division protein FtsL